ncbi:MAG TPA: TonB-dependent siderophore receptor [Steroidobacteraceae bacterium]|jgi:catecholate siderophore receptor
MRNAFLLRPTPLAAAILSVLQTAAMQADAAETSPPQELPKISVGDTADSAYKPEIVSSPKYTEALRDTPQSITVISKQLIEDQKLLSMRDILSTVPGITFGAGEGGGGYGDSITLRGFTGSSDITIDGVRDSAQYSRSDSFNLDQVEIVNGASSVYSGAGSVGGSINLVSKAAHAGDSSVISGGLGSDSYGRLTADINKQLSEGTALRLNVMGHRNDVPGRDYEEFKRWGIAPSLALGLGTDTVVTLSYLHQKDDNVPQYGVPYYNGGPLPGVDPSNYYGYHNVDEQQIETDSFTAIIDHHFSDALSVRNLSRVQKVGQLTVVDASQGTWCMPNNLQPTGAACVSGTGATAITVPVGQYLPSGPRGFVRDTTNKLLYNQTDFTGSFATGAIGHTVVAGLALSHETFELGSSSDFRNADGTNPFVAPNHLPFTDMFDPDSYYTGPINRTLTGKTDGEMDNTAVYVFDTLKFSEQWQLNAGVRYERNEGSSTVYNVQQAPTTTAAPPAGSPAIGTIINAAAPAKNNDDLLSYRAGLVYKPVESGTIYLSYGNSKTPSKTSVNGSCAAVPTVTNGVPQFNANCNVDPETAVNYELGLKWDLLDAKLALTAAIFRNDRENYRVNDPDPTNVSGQQSLDGKARVDGALLGIAGNIMKNWAVSANYSYLDSKVLQGASDFSASQGQDYIKGDPLLNVPKHAFSLWTTYRLPIGVELGYGATYQGDFYLTQHSATNLNGPLVTAPEYWIHRAMAAYRFGKSLDVQLNINNLFDKEYYTRIRNNGWATPGEARSFILSANYNF